MNDRQIRNAFHTSYLQFEHSDKDTLIVDEFGLEHGRCRADIAVINGHIEGFEIKSDCDTLKRLPTQIDAYNAVFDYATIVITHKHIKDVLSEVPYWWGIIIATKDLSDNINFSDFRLPSENPNINDYSVAQLLWRTEVQKILSSTGMKGDQLREKRHTLYCYLIDILDSRALKSIVKDTLKKRENWRDPEPLSLYGD